MSDLDELKKRKEQLMLERDIARLERLATVWRWFWVTSLALIGAFFFLLGRANLSGGAQYMVIMILGAIAVSPLLIKIFKRR